MEANLNAGIRARVDVLPVRSQVFLVVLALVGGMAVSAAAWLLGQDKPAGWAFLGLGLVVLCSALWGWTKSQVDVDLDQGHKTTVNLPGGSEISTDSRLLRSPASLRLFSELLNGILERQPLPEPTGRVDVNLVPIPNSRLEAIEEVNQINNDVQASTSLAIDQLRQCVAEPELLPQQVDRASDGPRIGTAASPNGPLVGG